MANSSLKSTIARKAAKTGAKHTAHGAASKLKRRPLRAGTLLAVGGAIGALAGWVAARRGAAAPSPR
jgi:ferric-dicitrate binding protein FerR (iron transport regulator)